MDFTSIQPYVLTYSRQDNYLYVSGTMEDDKNNPPLRWDTVKFEESVFVSVLLFKQHHRKPCKVFFHVAHAAIKFYRQKN